MRHRVATAKERTYRSGSEGQGQQGGFQEAHSEDQLGDEKRGSRRGRLYTSWGWEGKNS